MPDWPRHVREHLGALGIGPEREEEVVAELASHFEDAYEDSLERQSTPEHASTRAFSEVTNWVRLRKEIRRAPREEDPMSVHTKNLVLPGMTMLIGSAVLLLALLRLVPLVAWVHPKAPVLIFVPWLLAYCVFGALGAYWSRRSGGSIAARFLSGIFPIALHLAIIICVLFSEWVTGAIRHPEHFLLGFLLRAGLSFLVIPGVALALGALPFLRNHSNAPTQSRA